MLWCNTNGPTVSETKAGSGFPGYSFRGGKMFPDKFFAGAHDFFHGLESVPDGAGIYDTMFGGCMF
jgi:hypothetical protein